MNEVTMKIAEEDIHCFKVVSEKDGKYVDVFRGDDNEYELGKTYNDKMENGFRSFKGKLKDIEYRTIEGHKHKPTVPLFVTEEGCEHFQAAPKGSLVIDCTVPKGSRYFENWSHQLISDTIKVTGISKLMVLN